MEPNFYMINIGRPLSADLNISAWEWKNTTLGRLNSINSQVFLRKLPSGEHRAAEYAWRVVDAWFSQEDSTMTYFRAYNLDGKLLPEATFGVNWGSVPHKIEGGFKYPPEFGNRYYMPVNNDFHTPNTGGYTVQVLDRNWPSEGMAFGITKGDVITHQALVISFRLFPLSEEYPGG